MSKPFDATLKHLIEAHPRDWVQFAGLGADLEVRVVDAELSTLTAAADKVILIEGANPCLMDLELQASYDGLLGRRLLKYNVLLEDRHNLPVHSVVVLLRPEADGPEVSGVLSREFPGKGIYLEFRYQVFRVWEQPVESFLAGGLGIVPLAPLGQVSESDVPQVVRRMEERFRREAVPEEAAVLRTATFVLLGLRFSRAIVAPWIQGAFAMKESSTYQAILAEGREEGLIKGITEGMAQGMAKGMAQGMAQGVTKGSIIEAREILLRLGRRRLGPPDARVLATIQTIEDLPQLEALTERLLDVTNWQELLAGQLQ